MGKTIWLVIAGALLVVGIGSLFLEGFSYVTRETVIDAGPLQVTAEEEERVALPIWVSAVLVASGIGALLIGLKSRAS